MAKKLTEERLDRVKKEVLHGGGCLEKLAAEWNYTLEALREMLAAAYDGGVKNTQFKAIIRNSDRNASRLSKEELAKLQGMVTLKLVKQAKPLKVVLAPAIVPTTTEASPAPVVTPEDPMKELLRKKDICLGQLGFWETSIKEAMHAIEIRQSAFKEAQIALKKAQAAANHAEEGVKVAQNELRKAQERKQELQLMLQRVDTEIHELEQKEVYLIDPWYLGTLPQYGTFISTVEMEKVKKVEPAEYIRPDISDMMEAGFDSLPEYTKALAFVSLVQDFFLAGKEYKVLYTHERVEKLLNKYIG